MRMKWTLFFATMAMAFATTDPAAAEASKQVIQKYFVGKTCETSIGNHVSLRRGGEYKYTDSRGSQFGRYRVGDGRITVRFNNGNVRTMAVTANGGQFTLAGYGVRC